MYLGIGESELDGTNQPTNRIDDDDDDDVARIEEHFHLLTEPSDMRRRSGGRAGKTTNKTFDALMMNFSPLLLLCGGLRTRTHEQYSDNN